MEGAELARQTSQYDPKVEKSERYNHQRENACTKTRQWLSPVRRGLRTLQVQYSQTNTTHNDSLIFAHLLRAAHVKNAAVEESVYNMERRLYTRRHGDTPHATTFFDLHRDRDHDHDHVHHHRRRHDQSSEASGEMEGVKVGLAKKQQGSSTRRSVSASTSVGRSKGYSTVAKKKKERRERIKKKNDELEMGYTPRAQSLPQLGPEDIQAILRQCRHLRVSPQLQQHLYTLEYIQLEEHTTV